MLEQHLTQMARDLEMESSPVKDETGMYTLSDQPGTDGRSERIRPRMSVFCARGTLP